MLTLQGVTYAHPNKDILFSDLQLVINEHDKVALIGNNGAGKSTLLKLLAQQVHPVAGQVKTDTKPYYVPQLTDAFNNQTVAGALQIEDQLNALHKILKGEVSDENLAMLNDDWTLEERCAEAFAYWQLEGVQLTQKMHTLSGGQKTKVFLAGIIIHQPEIVLMDEPSNHLDLTARNILYRYIKTANQTLVVVSHDRTLLNLLDTMYELSSKGITVYGGNYDFYEEQKAIENNALNNELKNKEKALRKAKETERANAERQQKLDARGKKKQEKAGLPTISMNTFRNNAEKSTARMKDVHAEKVENISKDLNELRAAVPDADKMKMELDDSSLHTGKMLVAANNINFSYGSNMLWKQPLSFDITSGERIAVSGANGSGKTTLIKIICGEREPATGSIYRAPIQYTYIDQDYSLIDNAHTVYEQAEMFNTGVLQEHQIKIRLNRFLFTAQDWDKPCAALSGGEKMRLVLCCLTIANKAPDLIVLDEPTNNLDIQNLQILTTAINGYKGTLVVISHDERFLREINVARVIELSD